MASFHHFRNENGDSRCRLGILSIHKCRPSTQNENEGFGDVYSPVLHPMGDQVREDSTCGSARGDHVLVKTPAISVPTFKGFPSYIFPQVGAEKNEISTLVPDLDYLLMGFGVCKNSNSFDIDNEKKKNIDVELDDDDGLEDHKPFGYIRQPKPQMANNGYLMYMMFNQPLYEGGISSWNGPEDIIIRTESGRTNVSCGDIISCIKEYQPVLYVSPAEESNAGSYGKNASFRSIHKANDLLLKLLSYHTECKRTNSDKKFKGNETKVLANIQGAHFKNYRGAASLGVWDLCKGAGKGLENVTFIRETGCPELRNMNIKQSQTAKLYDEIILGVMIGGLGYKEDTSTRAECIEEIINHLPPDKLRFISFQIGSPIETLQAIYLGMDIIECPYIYKSSTRGIALTLNLDDFWINKEKFQYSFHERNNVKEFLLKGNFSSLSRTDNTCSSYFGGAKYIDLSDRKYSCDMEKIMVNSPVLHSRSYVHHLINSKEILGLSLLFMHNYWQYQSLLSSIRKAIIDGCFDDFVTWFVNTQTDVNIHPIWLPEARSTTYTYDGMDGLIH